MAVHINQSTSASPSRVAVARPVIGRVQIARLLITTVLITTVLITTAVSLPGANAVALVPDAPSGGPVAAVDSRPAAAVPFPYRAPTSGSLDPAGRLTAGRLGAGRLGADPFVVGRLAPSTGWTWPLAGVPTVMSPFSPGPYRWSAGHRGVDVAGSAGETVTAAGPGVVSFAGRVAGRGVVSVQHPGGLRTTYEPVQPRVRTGAPLSLGTAIGVLEAAGSHCMRVCLHWGLLRGERYLDPLSLLRRPRPPALLPLLS
jgi:murein DD-endopeptidase MepM/ murein hydrolase activator NlpD